MGNSEDASIGQLLALLEKVLTSLAERVCVSVSICVKVTLLYPPDTCLPSRRKELCLNFVVIGQSLH